MFNTKWWHNQGSVASLIVLLLSLGLALLLLLNRQYIVDQISVFQFKPTDQIAALAKRTSMTGHGTFLFYAAHPTIEDATNFNKKCGRQETSTAILGCYNGQDIYIYNVTDERLDGMREVTAAHEMLHVAYARLSGEEKSRVDTWVVAEYEKLKNDKDFAERMAFYDRTEPGERENELHSIIGTEVGSISASLEAYYQKYFQNRNEIVALHQKYAAVFIDLQKRGEEISAELTNLGKKIEQDSAQYNTDVNQLNQDIDSFNAKANSGGFTTGAAFQAERSALVARAEQLEAKRGAINASITTYNQLRDELATVASESDALNRSIDSSLAPAPSL